mmetsp:Transcript_72572/g.161273  ORF Transcript_72572/g.161273 Transcript_72572/m.161273 type:complete len:258 (+) Transcript_72572:467-1240(+)
MSRRLQPGGDIYPNVAGSAALHLAARPAPHQCPAWSLPSVPSHCRSLPHCCSPSESGSANDVLDHDLRSPRKLSRADSRPEVRADELLSALRLLSSPLDCDRLRICRSAGGVRGPCRAISTWPRTLRTSLRTSPPSPLAALAPSSSLLLSWSSASASRSFERWWEERWWGERWCGVWATCGEDCGEASFGGEGADPSGVAKRPSEGIRSTAWRSLGSASLAGALNFSDGCGASSGAAGESEWMSLASACGLRWRIWS